MKKTVFVLLIVIVMTPVLGAQIVKDASGKPVQAASPKPEVLTNSDVITLSNAHLSDEAIIGKINSTRGNFDVRTDALVTLKNAGVSDKVIDAVVKRNLASAASDSSEKSEVTPKIRLFFECLELLIILGFSTIALTHP